LAWLSGLFAAALGRSEGHDGSGKRGATALHPMARFGDGGSRRKAEIHCPLCASDVRGGAKPVQGRPRRFGSAVGCADCPAVLASLAWRITRYALRAALEQMRQVSC
jgi:hypothetical protein